LKILVTGGSGFFGSLLLKRILSLGYECINLDLNNSGINNKNLIEINKDILNENKIDEAFKNVDLVYHNIAAVPLVNNKKTFLDTNIEGTRIVIEKSIKYGVSKLINTSSSAIFGIPANNPVNEEDPCIPIDPYGKAKLKGEFLLEKYKKDINFVSIRPRTIIGPERLGIFQILYEWIYNNQNIPVLNGGQNIYQFIHVNDLVDFNISLIEKELKNDFINIGANNPKELSSELKKLINFAESGSKIKSLNKNIVKNMLLVTNFFNLTPLSTYHAFMYGESLYFDNNKLENQFEFTPKYSNTDTLIDGYKWYVENRDFILSNNDLNSPHKSPVKQKLLKLIPKMI